MTLYEPLRDALAQADPEAKNMTAVVAVWVTPNDRSLGFVVCADEPLDRLHLAMQLRQHADALTAGLVIDTESEDRRALRAALAVLEPESIQFRDDEHDYRRPYAGRIGIGLEWPDDRRHAILFEPKATAAEIIAEFRDWLAAHPAPTHMENEIGADGQPIPLRVPRESPFA